MKGKMQTTVLQHGAYPLFTAAMTPRRLAASVALGLALMHAPTMALAQDSAPAAGPAAAAPSKASDEADAKKHAGKKDDGNKDVQNLDGVTVTGNRTLPV